MIVKGAIGMVLTYLSRNIPAAAPDELSLWDFPIGLPGPQQRIWVKDDESII